MGKVRWKADFVGSSNECLSRSVNCILIMRVEFFNAHLVHFWKDKVVGVQLSRSRPYQKNDNRMVEQKNDSLVRHYLGHWRFDTAEQVQAINLLVSSHVAVLQSVPTGDALNREGSGRQQGPPQVGRGANARRAASWQLACSRLSNGSACKPSMSRPIPSPCGERSISA